MSLIHLCDTTQSLFHPQMIGLRVTTTIFLLNNLSHHDNVLRICRSVRVTSFLLVLQHFLLSCFYLNNLQPALQLKIEHNILSLKKSKFVLNSISCNTPLKTMFFVGVLHFALYYRIFKLNQNWVQDHGIFIQYILPPTRKKVAFLSKNSLVAKYFTNFDEIS